MVKVNSWIALLLMKLSLFIVLSGVIQMVELVTD